MTTFRMMTALLILAGMFLAGCTTDQPIFTNVTKIRLEGIELYNRGDYENAVGTFRNAVRTDPRDFRSQYYLGLTYERLDNYQQAIQSYRSALKVMRETPAGREAVDFRQVIMNTLASTISRHDADHMEQDFIAKQAADPKSDSQVRAEDYFLLAKIERYGRDPDTALTDYFKASELDKNDFWLQKEAGLYMLQMGKSNQAVKPLRRAVELNGRDPEVLAAMRQLKLQTPPALIQNEGGAKPLTTTTPLPAVPLKVGDAPVTLPEQLPVD